MQYFLDSSAMVKRYVHETGSAWVENLAGDSANEILLANITGVEVTSALARRGRAPNASAAQAMLTISDFRFDFANAYRILPVTPAVVARAMTLAERHALRGYDAVQLAAALELNAALTSANLPALTFISADAALNAAASAETLPTDDPNAHP